MASFDDAVDTLPSDGQTRVHSVLTEWAGTPSLKLRRIAHNIRNETALGLTEFRQLLVKFADELDGGTEPVAAWIEACRASKLVGASVTDAACPEVIGRALTIGTYAHYLVEDAGLSLRDAKDLVRRAIREGNRLSPPLRRTLERTRVGRYIVWATFDHTQPTRHPFEGLKRTNECVRTSYGLGHCSKTEAFVLLAYQRSTIELRRPTVADAEDYEWYQPHPDPSHPYGWTEPLPPNNDGHLAQPEVVHEETQAGSLVLPIYSTT